MAGKTGNTAPDKEQKPKEPQKPEKVMKFRWEFQFKIYDPDVKESIVETITVETEKDNERQAYLSASEKVQTKHRNYSYTQIFSKKAI